MQIIPVKGYVVLSELKPESKTSSGLIIPNEETPENVAVLESDPNDELMAEEGDKVMFNRYNAHAISGKFVVKTQDIIAIIKD